MPTAVVSSRTEPGQCLYLKSPSFNFLVGKQFETVINFTCGIGLAKLHALLTRTKNLNTEIKSPSIDSTNLPILLKISSLKVIKSL